MSEQTANLCTTDAAESLREIVAERDREIERLKEGQSILILARDEQKRLANEYRGLWSRAALKAQPSGVVHHNLIEAIKFYANGDHLLLADPDAWDTCSGEPINFLHDDAGTASVEDGSIAKAALDSLNSSPVSAGDDAQYPPCDYCAEPLSYHPWHGSGLINGVESRHIHACDKCRHLLPAVSAVGVDERAAQCDHQWTDDGLHLLVCTSCGAQEDHDPHWRDMATAPRDGTMVRLLVEFTEHETEDADQAPTIGANNFDNDGEDRWQFAGWCWSHDHFVEGKGEPVGWLPMIEARAALSAPSHGEQVREGWKLVPVEPTPEMLAATIAGGKMESRTDLRTMIYRAMLAAAPSAGSQEQG